jgi:hypothetical protein
MTMFSNAFPVAADNHVDFAAVKAASIGSIETLVSRWLPQGKRVGNQWISRNPTRDDAAAGSFSVNLRSGVWSDFATSETGGDMIDFFCYLNRASPLDRPKAVGELLGVRSSGESVVHLLRLKPNASDDLCPTGQQFAFAERHLLPSFIAMLQALQNGEAI